MKILVRGCPAGDGRGLLLLRRHPQLAVPAAVRVINRAPCFEFFVFFPFYFTRTIGLSTSEYRVPRPAAWPRPDR